MADGNIVLQPGEGKKISALGNEIISKAASEDTGGVLWVMEYTVAAGFGGPPPHVHAKTIEMFYVLEGELAVRVGEGTVTASPGAFVLVSKGTVHTFSNPGTRPVRYLGIISPGGLEKYFDELPELIAKHGYPPPPKIMAELGERYDMTVKAVG